MARVYRPLFVTLILVVGVLVVEQQAWSHDWYKPGSRLHAETPTLLDGFGWTVASNGSAVVVGAPHATGSRGEQGQAFLFQQKTGKLLQTFLPSLSDGDGFFGLPVGLTEQFVVVGAPQGAGRLRRPTGNVSIFDRNDGTLSRTVISPNSTAATFGHALAWQGPWIANGDPGASSPTHFDVGEVLVFEIATGTLVQTFIAPDVRHGKPDRFEHALAFLGSALAISTPLAGTDPLDHGRVYIFDILTGQLTQTLESPVLQTNAYFGWSLASDAEALLIGALGHGRLHSEAGSAYVFTAQGEFQQNIEAPHPQQGDHFGEAVALLNAYYVIAAPGDDAAGVDAGAVFMFDKQTHRLHATIPNPSQTTGVADLFGLSMSGYDAFLVVGSPYDDLAQMPDAGEVHQFHFQRSVSGD